MLSGPVNLQCPACGHVFMSTLTRPDASETCPRCAFVSPLLQYTSVTPTLGAEPVRFQKRIQKAHEPDQAAPAAQSWQPPPAANAWQAAAPLHRQPAYFTQPQAYPAPPVHQPASWPGMAASAQQGAMDQEPAFEPKKKSSIAFWLTVSALSIAACGFTGLLAWEKIKQRIKYLQAAEIAKAGAPVTSAGRFALPSMKVDPLEELNQRVLTGSAMAEADRLIKVLFNSSSTDDRLKAVSDPYRHRAEVAAMFDDNPDRPALVALTPISNPPLSLATRQRMPMFKVVTSKNRTGALVATTAGDSGETVIQWELFRETHDGDLARYIEAKNQQPRWFFVGLRRIHSFDLPQGASGEFDAIDIDGSTDGGGHIVTYVAKESPLGRHFARNVEWDKFYFGHVLVSWMDIAGENRPALLDCEGAPPVEGQGSQSVPSK